MKALVKAESRPGLWLQDVPEPQIEADEVLIKVLRAGLCGTDLHIQNWDHWAQKN
ncbi:MAG: threonine 3-dehydrogenase, partial [Kribbellaceae bacterium]|nr:threonine 3-dehydrogenase [Kribbellaceae bacterium]